jgi:NADPH:quinone reductase
MTAILTTRPGEAFPSGHSESLLDAELPKPSPGGGDLVVRVEAISVSLVDTNVRAPKPRAKKTPRVLGWDAAGVVETAGPAATRFRPGDEAYYAGGARLERGISTGGRAHFPSSRTARWI